ncbi:uncharacterized protein BDW70DRAFT_140897 [Aspergillus foveolatus]|uniref:uncharacterized protein n=1 Tax=Aspergillus foveolatus TaxID=210207 RepID=UPI003CCD078F
MADVLRDCVPPNVCSNACRSLSLLSRLRLPVTVRQRPRLASRPHPRKRACCRARKGLRLVLPVGISSTALSAPVDRTSLAPWIRWSFRLHQRRSMDHGPLWPRLESHSIWLPEDCKGSGVVSLSRVGTWTLGLLRRAPPKTVAVDSDLVQARTRPGDR